jgi:hypothetical protein
MKALTLFDYYNSDEEFRVEFMETYNKLVSHEFDFDDLPNVFEEMQKNKFSIFIPSVCSMEKISLDRLSIETKQIGNNLYHDFYFKNIKTINNFLEIFTLLGINLNFKKSYINLVLNE